MFLLGVRTCTEKAALVDAESTQGGYCKAAEGEFASTERQLPTLKGSLPALKGATHWIKSFPLQGSFSHKTLAGINSKQHAMCCRAPHCI